MALSTAARRPRRVSDSTVNPATFTPGAGATRSGLSPQLHFSRIDSLGCKPQAAPTPRTGPVGLRARGDRQGRAGIPDGGRRGPVTGRPVTEEAGAKSSCPRLLGGGRGPGPWSPRRWPPPGRQTPRFRGA